MMPARRPRGSPGVGPAFAFAFALGLGAGCAGAQIARDVVEVRHQARLAHENGAMRCAPRQLALAETNVEFASRELDLGDYRRARQHLRVADDNAREALRLSPRDRCVGPGKPVDSDADGIADAADKCPRQPEDKDGFEDADGCPDPDNDKDGVADADDRCPNDPGPVDNQGCPKKYEHIVVTEAKIELKQKIFFETDKAVIMARSFSLLSEIANVLHTRPAMRVRIEGHTDSRGAKSYNLSLSQARADAVRHYLVGMGIAAERLETRGFGSEQPIETNKTAAGREKNRRVELVITQQ